MATLGRNSYLQNIPVGLTSKGIWQLTFSKNSTSLLSTPMHKNLQRSQTIPNKFHKLFWDTDPTLLDLSANSQAIIERVINIGDLSAISWLFSTYGLGEITGVLKSSYNISQRAVRLWAEILNFQVKECRCTQRPLLLSRFN